MSDKLIEFGYTAAWRVVRLLPEAVAARAFTMIADRVVGKNGAAIQQLRKNLRRVVGPDMPPERLDDLTRDAMRSYCRYWMEAFRLPSYSLSQVRERFFLEGCEMVDRYREQGTGVIFALPHSGNWDMAGAWMVAEGYSITTVAERLKPEAVYDKFLEFRRGLGMEILPHVGGERPLHTVLSERLAEGHVVPLLADRDLSRNGVKVDFFGETTRMPSGPALLSIRTKAPLFTVVLHNDGPRHGYGKIIGPIPVPETGRLVEKIAAMTQAMADGFADKIAAHPADWHMLQRLWLADLDDSGGPPH